MLLFSSGCYCIYAANERKHVPMNTTLKELVESASTAKSANSIEGFPLVF